MLKPRPDKRGVTGRGHAMPLLIRLLVNAAALWVATRIVTGVTYSGALLPFLGVALVFGVVNAFIRPVLKLVTFPLIIVTFGIFALVVNGLMLWLTSSLSSTLGLGFHVSGFSAAFWGALVVSVVSTLLGIMIHDRDERD
jgi:putative membrane protein